MKNTLPKWATAVFEQMLQQTKRLEQTLHLAANGITRAQHNERAIAFLMESKTDDETIDPERLERAREETELAKREVTEDFPVLHAQAVVTLWAYFEACVRQLLTAWIQNEPSCLRNKAFEEVQVKLADYERLDAIERAYFVVDVLEKKYAVGLKNGTKRFEVLLSALELDGEVPDRVSRNIFELGQVRNVIMHRAGMADKKFVEACPWLKVQIGEFVSVTHVMYSTYNSAVLDYFMLIMFRVAEQFGVDVETERREVFERNDVASNRATA